MNRTFILAGLVWGASLVAAGWLGRTYFADSTSIANAPARAGVSSVSNAAGAANPTVGATKASLQSDGSTPTSKPSSLFNDVTKTPEERLKALFEIEDPVEKMTAFMQLLPTLQTNEDFSAAVGSMMENFDPRGRGRELSMMMTEWAKRDPLAALTAAAQVKDWPGKYAASAALQTWVKSDPQAAKNWAMENGKDANKDEGNYYMVSVISGLAKTDLSTAAAWAQEQPRSKARGDMMEKILDGFTKQRGTSAATDWAASLEAGPFKDGVTRRLADRLSEKDPNQAATWIATLPAGDSKVGAMAELMDNWAHKDPNAAGLWLKNYQPSPETDQPRQTFAWNIRESDPEAAIAWAGTISDPKLRDNSMVDLLRDWKKRDQKSAQSYMLNNKWPEATIKKVLN
jgi:hypothetical protein